MKETRVELLIASVNSEPNELISRINIQTPAVIANQGTADYIKTIETKKGNIKFVSTSTRGVGINRNIGLNLSSQEYVVFIDDDMVLVDNYEEIILNEFKKENSADMILFNFDFVSDNQPDRARIKKTQKLNMAKALQHGICATAVKRNSIEINNLSFSTLFGGGCIYGCGEDSLFFLDAFRCGLNVYSSKEKIGNNVFRESTWFSGHNKKFFYDKGAWIACAFKRPRFFMKLFFLFRFHRIAECSLGDAWMMLSMGAKNYDKLIPYSENIKK